MVGLDWGWINPVKITGGAASFLYRWQASRSITWSAKRVIEETTLARCHNNSTSPVAMFTMIEGHLDYTE
jgi:hypothetical protein